MTADPSDEARLALSELLDRLGRARAVLSQASGWIRELSGGELRAWGIDLKPGVAEQLEAMVANIDRIIESIRGNDLAKAQILYNNEWPKLRGLLQIAQKLLGLG